MVSGLIYYRQDPQGKGRPAGYYYYRGAIVQPNGQRIKTWSRYTENLDGNLKHPKTKVRNVKRAEEKEPHKADYKSGVRRNRRNPKSNLGYF